MQNIKGHINHSHHRLDYYPDPLLETNKTNRYY